MYAVQDIEDETQVTLVDAPNPIVAVKQMLVAAGSFAIFKEIKEAGTGAWIAVIMGLSPSDYLLEERRDSAFHGAPAHASWNFKNVFVRKV
jgi:hypothetical protein